MYFYAQQQGGFSPPTVFCAFYLKNSPKGAAE